MGEPRRGMAFEHHPPFMGRVPRSAMGEPRPPPGPARAATIRDGKASDLAVARQMRCPDAPLGRLYGSFHEWVGFSGVQSVRRLALRLIGS